MNLNTLAKCLDEYLRRYVEDPEQFSGLLDDGKPVERYGERVAKHLAEIASDLGLVL